MASKFGPYTAYTQDPGTGFLHYGILDKNNMQVLDFHNGKEEYWSSFDLAGQTAMVSALTADDGGYLDRRNAHYFSLNGVSQVGAGNIPDVITLLQGTSGSSLGDNNNIALAISLLRAQ